MLSPPLFMLAVPTFLLRPALTTLVSWFWIICLLISTFQMSVILLMWKSDKSALAASTWLLKQSKLMCAFVLFKLDCFNSLLSGCPFYMLRGLQKVQNSAVKLVFRSHKRDHVHPLLQALHWLPVQARVDCKMSTVSVSVTTSSLTHPLSTCLTFSLCTHLTLLQLLRQHCSTDTGTLHIPHELNFWPVFFLLRFYGWSRPSAS